ncbi:MAG: hypothetical protein E7348_06520 [Clostridiales bacterium]|nr:hypothetical protein [Clostridiales bacterium]
MKKILMIFCCFIMLFLWGCRKTSFNFLHNKSEIVSIAIVTIEEYDSGIPLMTTIVNVDDLEMFLSDFLNLKCYSIWTDPKGVYAGDTAIKFQYSNQEFQLVTCSGQAKYVFSDYFNDYYFNSYAGYYYFDQYEFDNLIKKYTIHTYD